MQTSGASRREAAKLCLELRFEKIESMAIHENERAALSAVIARHRVGASRRPMTGSGGRSSIPRRQ
jgi:hypothetical protein